MRSLLVLVGLILLVMFKLNSKEYTMAWDTEILNKAEKTTQKTSSPKTLATPTVQVLQDERSSTGVSESAQRSDRITPNVGYDVIVQDEDTLSQGDRDAKPNGIISSVQKKLNDLGLDVGDVDGVIGRKTSGTIQEAQGMLGLPRTGVLDKKTRLGLITLSPNQINFLKNNPKSEAGYQNLGENVPVTTVKENVVEIDATPVDKTTAEPVDNSDRIVEASLTANQNNTTLSKESIENQVRELVGTNIRAAGILGAFSKEAGVNFDNLEENTNYSLSNARDVPFSDAKINAALASLDPEVRQKIKKGGRDRRFGEALMSHYGGGGRYHGRGLIHITHDSNYRAVGDRIGVDLVANPDLVKDPRYAVPAAMAYLEMNRYFNTDREITRDSLHSIVNRHASNAIKNGRWANTQAYLRDWQGEAAVETSPRPQERPEATTE
jgi:predicted chitinase